MRSPAPESGEAERSPWDGGTTRHRSPPQRGRTRHYSRRPANPAKPTTPEHQSGAGPQVRGTLHLIQERLRPILVLSARQPRDEPWSCRIQPTYQRSINRRHQSPPPDPCSGSIRSHNTPGTPRPKKTRPHLETTDIRG